MAVHLAILRPKRPLPYRASSRAASLHRAIYSLTACKKCLWNVTNSLQFIYSHSRRRRSTNRIKTFNGDRVESQWYTTTNKRAFGVNCVGSFYSCMYVGDNESIANRHKLCSCHSEVTNKRQRLCYAVSRRGLGLWFHRNVSCLERKKSCAKCRTHSYLLHEMKCVNLNTQVSKVYLWYTKAPLGVQRLSANWQYSK